MVKQCELCGKAFEARHSRAKYCPDCRRPARLERQRKYNREYYRNCIRNDPEKYERRRAYIREYHRRWYIKQKLKILHGERSEVN